MSLVDYLRALQSTTAARPGNMSQTITPIGDGQNQGFVMPADGWVSIGGSYQNNEYGAAFIWGDAGKERPTASMSSNNSFGFTAQALGFFKKGERVNYNLHGFTNYYARIFPVIGGGINSIIQSGGTLCLRLNHSFKRFSSYPAGKRFRLMTESNSQYLKVRRGLKRIPHRLTDTFKCGAWTLHMLSYQTLRRAFALEQKRVLQLVYLCRSKKAIRSTASANTLARQILDSISLSPSAHLSFCKGGAL